MPRVFYPIQLIAEIICWVKRVTLAVAAGWKCYNYTNISMHLNIYRLFSTLILNTRKYFGTVFSWDMPGDFFTVRLVHVTQILGTHFLSPFVSVAACWKVRKNIFALHYICNGRRVVLVTCKTWHRLITGNKFLLGITKWQLKTIIPSTCIEVTVKTNYSSTQVI